MGVLGLILGSCDRPNSISLVPSELDLGADREGTYANFESCFKNSSSQPIQITELVGSCSCTKMNIDKWRLNPGETAFLRGQVQRSRKPGKSEISVKLRWKDKDQATKEACLSLSVETATAANLNPEQIQQTDSCNSQAQKFLIQVTRGKARGSWNEIRASASDLATDVRWKSKDTADVTASFKSSLPDGPFHDSVKIELFDAGKPTGIVYKVPIYTSFSQHLESKPKTLLIGALQNGDTRSGKFTIRTKEATDRITIDNPIPDFLSISSMEKSETMFVFSYQATAIGLPRNLSGKIWIHSFTANGRRDLVIPFFFSVR
jgi:hypothetical protein